MAPKLPTVGRDLTLGDKFSKNGDKFVGVLGKIRDGGGEANQSLGKMSVGIKQVGVAAGVTGAAIVTATAAVVKLTVDIADNANAIAKQSEAIGLTTESYQMWGAALKSVGMEAEQVEDIVSGLVGQISAADDGSQDYLQTFEALGVQLRDSSGALREQSTLVTETVVALAGMENQTRRNAIADKLFGDAGLKLTPILNQGADAVQNMLENNRDAITVTEDLIDASERYATASRLVARELTAAKNEAFTPLVELTADIAEQMMLDISSTPFAVGFGIFEAAVSDVADEIRFLLEELGLLQEKTQSLPTDFGERYKNAVSDISVATADLSIYASGTSDALAELTEELDNTGTIAFDNIEKYASLADSLRGVISAQEDARFTEEALLSVDILETEIQRVGELSRAITRKNEEAAASAASTVTIPLLEQERIAEEESAKAAFSAGREKAQVRLVQISLLEKQAVAQANLRQVQIETAEQELALLDAIQNKKDSHWETEQERAMERVQSQQTFFEQTMATNIELASAVQTARSAETAAIMRRYSAEERAIRDSTKSEKRKEQERAALEKKKAAAEEESAKRQLAFVAVTGAANTALAIQAQILAILNVTKDTPGGLFVKVGAGLAMAGATAKYITDIKAAQSAIPNREHGGGVRANQIVQVAERGKPEMFSMGGEDFMISPQAGTVTPVENGVGGGNMIVNNFYLQDVDELEERGPEIMARSLEMADRAGSINYGAMPNFQRELRRS